MASNFQYFLLLLFISTSSSSQDTSLKPKALILPVTKDTSTLQYITQIYQRTPLVPLNLILDLGGQNLWVNCEKQYTSSTYSPARCNSAVCHLADYYYCTDCYDSPKPGCNNNTCTLLADNTIDGTITVGDVGQDVVSVQSMDGVKPGQNVAVSQFIFGCAPSYSLSQFADGVSGMAGLGRTKVSLPSQFAPALGFRLKFGICLASHSKGAIFIGNSPYVSIPNFHDDEDTTCTPLIVNPVSTASNPREGRPSSEYFIDVKSIKIDEKMVPNINKKLLSINKEGYGGTKLSTVQPYMVLEASIYKAVTESYIKTAAARNITRVAGVAPFEVCFNDENAPHFRVGPDVPSIELGLPNGGRWPFYGSNTVVRVAEHVLCLAVMNGGKKPRTSIVIGGNQLENHLIQIDLASSKLGFSPSLYWYRTSCGNLNLTTTTTTSTFTFTALDHHDWSSEFENKMSLSAI